MNICILVYFSLYVIIYSGRTNFFALSQLELSPSKFVIITKNSQDESKIDENDLTKYDTANNHVGVRYKFKNTSKCVGLKYDNIPIWTYDSQINGENYPIEILFNSHSNNVRIKTKNRLYIYSYINDNWNLILESEVTSDSLNKYQPFARANNDLTLDPKSEYHSKKYIDSEDTSPIVAVSSNEFVRKLSDNQIQILTVDKRLRLQANDLTHFFITKFQNLTTYKLVNLRMYCEVKHKGDVLWIDKRHRSKAVFPDLIHIYTDDDIICLDFTGTKFLMHNRRRFYMFTQFVKEVYREPSIKAEEENTTSFHLKLKFDGSSGSANTTVLEIKPKSPGVSKKFNNGEKCVEIASENMTIWKRDPLRDGGNYPTEVYSDYFIKKIVKIKFAGRAYSYSYAHDQWYLKTLSIDGSSSHRMDTEPIDGLDGDTTEASSEEYSDEQQTIGESTDPSTTEQSTDLTTDDEEYSEITPANEEPTDLKKANEEPTDLKKANEEPTDVTAASEEPSATESSTGTETGEPISNETAKPIPTHSTDSALATGSPNANSTDTSSDTLTSNAATSENGNDGQVIESSVYL